MRDDIRWGVGVGRESAGASIWSNLGKLVNWSARKILKSDKDEWEIGYMELNNPV